MFDYNVNSINNDSITIISEDKKVSLLTKCNQSSNNGPTTESLFTSSQKRIKTPIALKQLITSPSHHISCMCNCSNSSQSQSVTETPIHQPPKQITKKLRFSKLLDLEQRNNKALNFNGGVIDEEDNPYEFNCQNSKGWFQNNNLNSKNSIIQQREFDLAIQKNFGDIIQTIKNTIDKSEVRLRESERREIIQNEWSDVAMILDRLLCYFFSISTLLICFIIFLNSPHTLTAW